MHGQSKRYHHTRVGLGGRMDTLQCAVVLAKLERFEWELDRRHAIGARYAELLEGLPGIRRLVVRPDRDCVWAQYTIFVSQRDEVQARLAEEGVPTAVHYPKPLHRQPAYASYAASNCCPRSDAVAELVMSLPMSADLSQAQQDRVVTALRKAMSGAVAVAIGGR